VCGTDRGERGRDAGWRVGVPGADLAGGVEGGGRVVGECGEQQYPVAGGDGRRGRGVRDALHGGPGGRRVTGLQERFAAQRVGLDAEGRRGVQDAGRGVRAAAGEGGVGGGDPHARVDGDAGQPAREQQQVRPVAAGGAVRGGEGQPVRAVVVAGGGEVAGGFGGRGEVGEAAVQVGAGGGVEQPGRGLRDVCGHRDEVPGGVGGDQAGGVQVGGAGAEEVGGGGPAEQAEGGQGGARGAGQVGEGGGDGVRDLVDVAGGGSAAGGGVPGEGGDGQGVAAGAVGDGAQRGVAEVRGGAAGQVEGGAGVERRHVEPGGGGLPQRGDVGAVRGAQGDQDTAVGGEVRQRGEGGRVGVLHVVEDEQATADAGADGLGEQVHVVGGQPGADGAGQGEGGDAGEHGEAAAGVHGAGCGGGDGAQQGAAPAAGWAGEHDEAGAAQVGSGGGGEVVRVRHASSSPRRRFVRVARTRDPVCLGCP
jgi:hypothetical protein